MDALRIDYPMERRQFAIVSGWITNEEDRHAQVRRTYFLVD
jgi:hypothetical protein